MLKVTEIHTAIWASPVAMQNIMYCSFNSIQHIVCCKNIHRIKVRIRLGSTGKINLTPALFIVYWPLLQANKKLFVHPWSSDAFLALINSLLLYGCHRKFN